MVDVADGVQPVAARSPGRLSSTVEPASRAPGRPCPGRGRRCAGRGRWRTGSRRPRCGSPSSSDDRDRAVRLAGSTGGRRRRRYGRRRPASLQRLGDQLARRTAPSAAAGPSPRTSTVTSEPSACQAVAISTADHAAADHDEPAGHLLGAGGLAAGPGADLGESRAGRGATARVPVHTATACRAVSTLPLAVGAGDGDLAGAGRGGRGRGTRSAPIALQPVDLAVVLPVRRSRRRGGRGPPRRPAGPATGGAQAGHAAGVGAGDHRAQQGLARHAGPVRALAADQLALHDRGGQPGGAGPVGDVLPDRPRADDHDVVRRNRPLRQSLIRHGVSLVGGVRGGHMGTSAEYAHGAVAVVPDGLPERDTRKRDHAMSSTVELTKENFDQTVTRQRASS